MGAAYCSQRRKAAATAITCLRCPTLQPTNNKIKTTLSQEKAESKGRSPLRKSVLRNKSRSPSGTWRGRSPSREHVSWPDSAKG
ncbi:hypothetical protein HPB48_003351 [Haemaphysalis longicornis]|uniref:Uncharacterized protein n=1 Tax=Haemaphysalis longicornis TaxID=44386 RepID=A0A9J6G8E8_HAELO|nr:hypothetical protein HPB48_003351 [Haemaphysalis longicornis]